MRCYECGDKCEKPITKVDMSFDYGNARYGAADWDDKKKKAYCGVACMMKDLKEEAARAVREHKE